VKWLLILVVFEKVLGKRFMKVRILAKRKRAKERVRSHGEIMELVDPMILGLTGGNEGSGRFLVRSLGKSWRGENWLGWFDLNEATFQRMDGDL
jgi:hypothetical protein